MKQIQKLIPEACIATEEFILKGNPSIDSAFNGYISSFGASIISAGLLPSVIFFSHKGQTDADRPAIIKSIEYILQKHGFIGAEEKLLLLIKNYVEQNNRSALARLTEKINLAAVALKLAIRTYPETVI
jgi:CRISPR/Cas system CMR-associated protein Cmr5 small subunit